MRQMGGCVRNEKREDTIQMGGLSERERVDQLWTRSLDGACEGYTPYMAPGSSIAGVSENKVI
jgi:hypothetical protein